MNITKVHLSKTKIFLEYFFIVLIISYFVNALIKSTFWRFDSHHDGYVYLQAYLGSKFQLMPENIHSAYGIAQPFLEGLILQLIGTQLVSYRIIGFLLIIGTSLYIFFIGKLYAGRQFSLLMALVWFCANPIWSGFGNEFKSLQAVWPNLWIQFLSLVVLYNLFSGKMSFHYGKITSGLILASLPFFRLQGALLVLPILIYISIKYKKTILFWISYFLGTSFWLFLITLKGGIPLYLKQIIMEPSEGMSRYTSLNYLLLFIKNNATYYFYVFVLILFIFALFNSKLFSKFSFVSMVTFLLIIPIKNPRIWLNTISLNINTLILDFFILVAFLHIFIRTIRRYKLKLKKNENLNSIIMAWMVVLSATQLYPLPDLGHKWWTTAFPAIYILYFINEIGSYNLNYSRKLKDYFMKVALFSIICSLYFAHNFIEEDYASVQVKEFKTLNAIKIPLNEKLNFNGFLLSSSIIEIMQKENRLINYSCRDGMYYLQPFTPEETIENALNYIPPNSSIDDSEIHFICSVRNLDSILNLPLKYRVKIDKGSGVYDIFVIRDQKMALRYFPKCKFVDECLVSPDNLGGFRD